jgi:hypothetical protein
MATGTLTLALLTLSAGAVPPDVVPMNGRNFQIPIHIAEGQRGKIKELILFTSSDQGATWNETQVAPPDKDAFVFYAPSDGVYWFNICVVDAQGRREPPDIYKSPPRQKVLVDTLPPNVRIVSAERQGDDVVVAWEIQEDHPDLATLKLEYRAADAAAWTWTPVSMSPALSGQTRFHVATAGPVTIHLQLADDAGNVGDAQAEVRAKSGVSNPSAPAIVPATLQSNATPPIAPATANPHAQTGGGPAPAPSSASAPVPNTISTAPPAGSWDSSPPVQPVSLRRNDPPSPPERQWGSSPASGYQQTGWDGGPNRPTGVDAASRNGQTVASMGYAYAPTSTVGGLRGLGDVAGAVEISNNTQITLDYEVTRQGPSGIGKVELYLTGDEGRSWQRYYEDVHPKPPMTVNLPGEGIFGLRLVVTSGAGLARKAPQPGDSPQMRVEVDLTPPAVRLFPPQPDPTRRDALLLTWNASDRNLAANPITLEYAERPDGPWVTIAKELTNTGRYQWLLPQNMPVRVYLHVLAIDAAGNKAMDQTPEPVLIDPSEPEGQIKGIVKTVRRP